MIAMAALMYHLIIVIIVQSVKGMKVMKMKNKLKWIAVIGVVCAAYILGSVNTPTFTEPMPVILYDRTNKAIMQYEAYPEIEKWCFAVT